MKGFLKMLAAAFLGSAAALLIGVMIIFSILGSIMALANKPEEIVPESTVLKINLSTPVIDYSEDDPLSRFNPMDMGSMGKSPIQLMQAVRAITAAAMDPAVKFIYINASDCAIDMGTLEELREALQSFRELSGKPVIAYINNLNELSSYYLATVADKIYMNSDGMAMVSGIGAHMFFLKDCLDAAGLEMQLIRHGKYKSAGEMFIANKISDANREQNEQLFQSLWSVIASAVASSREVEMDRFYDLVHNLKLTTAATLLDNKLVDDTLSLAGMEQKICGLLSVEEFNEVNMTSLEGYAQAKIKENLKAKERIAVLYANGEIVESGTGLASSDIVPIINKLKDDNAVKAVVLRVNSPGGDAHAAELIRRALMELKAEKPLVVSMGEYAASGGYWISAQADKIYAESTTLTGSIGVFSLIPNASKLAGKLGVNATVIGTGPHVGMATPLKPLDAVEREYMQEMVEEVYDRFTTIVSQGRKMTKEHVDSLAQGRVWSGLDAMAVNLVDEVGTLSDAIAYAADLAGIENGYRIVQYPWAPTAMEALLKRFGAAEAAASKLSSLNDNPQEAVLEIFSEALNSKKPMVYARLPFICNMIY